MILKQNIKFEANLISELKECIAQATQSTDLTLQKLSCKVFAQICVIEKESCLESIQAIVDNAFSSSDPNVTMSCFKFFIEIFKISSELKISSFIPIYRKTYSLAIVLLSSPNDITPEIKISSIKIIKEGNIFLCDELFSTNVEQKVGVVLRILLPLIKSSDEYEKSLCMRAIFFMFFNLKNDVIFFLQDFLCLFFDIINCEPNLSEAYPSMLMLVAHLFEIFSYNSVSEEILHSFRSRLEILLDIYQKQKNLEENIDYANQFYISLLKCYKVYAKIFYAMSFGNSPEDFQKERKQILQLWQLVENILRLQSENIKDELISTCIDTILQYAMNCSRKIMLS